MLNCALIITIATFQPITVRRGELSEGNEAKKCANNPLLPLRDMFLDLHPPVSSLTPGGIGD